MYDLIYDGADARRAIAASFPDARIEDASDFVHKERFSVELPDALEDTYLKHVIASGLAPASFTVQLMRLNDEGRAKLRTLLTPDTAAPHQEGHQR